MDRILMENMEFYGYHGVLEAEKTLGQKFRIDAALFLPLREAGRTDDPRLTADYAAVYTVIRDVVTQERFALLEALAERICRAVFSAFPPVQKIRVRVRKPGAPVAGSFDSFGVEIERCRDDDA